MLRLVDWLKLDEQGRMVAIAQDRLTGQVRMVGWMTPEALERTLQSGRATFFSRSRGKLWEKGESSGNGLVVREVVADCDGDTLLLLVDPEGPSCHTGRPSCFFRRVLEDGQLEERASAPGAFLDELERTIEQRQRSTAERSYTRSLLDGGSVKIGAKLREEADELARAIDAESDERVAAEAADLLFHTLVALRSRGLGVRAVIEVLATRAGVSGHDEKASRKG